MGLSGPKVKQKIGKDPRNLSWSDDAARFGSSYLSKFGWDPSKGLGVGGEGRTSHIKVAQKLDMMGIGAAHQADPNGIAWKQNKDFENLLKRLNEANGDVEGENAEEGESGTVINGFVQQQKKGKGGERRKGKKVRKAEADSGDEMREKIDKNDRGEDKGKQHVEDVGEKKKKKKRKRGNSDADEELREKKKKSSRNSSTDNEKDEKTPTPPEPTPTVKQKVARVVPRHRSHRARHIAAKSLASKSATAISEILGIAPTPSPLSSGTRTPQEPKLTSIYDENNEDNVEMNKITTSTKSLQDYFKAKIGGLKGLAGLAGGAAVTSQGLDTAEADYDDVPRGGLGSRRKRSADADIGGEGW